MNLQKTVLSNGVRVVTERLDHVGSASIGLWCQTGSCHETDAEAGITHLIEHMLFKGTPRRTSQQIAEEIEGRGGSLNAFTDKQVTCYYARTLKEDAGVAVDVLSDMMTNSTMDPAEITLEKQVVLEEIKRGEDEPSDKVHELHLGSRWPNHPLGKPVIGTKESVASFEREHLAAYMDRRYRGGHIMLAAAGKVDHDSMVKLAEAHLGGIKAGREEFDAPRPQGVAGNTYEGRQDIEQVNFCIGTDAPSIYDDELYTAALLDHILGGGMSSRLFQEVREKRGLAYAIGTYSLNYSHGGAMTVYGGTSPDTWQQVQDLVRIEFDRMMNDGPTEDELTKNKKAITGSLVISLESTSSRMMRLARNELVRGRDVPVDETTAKINAVTRDAVITLAQKLLSPDRISVTAIGPNQG